MKISKLSFWLVILVGIMGIFASVFAFLTGEALVTYLLSGFSGLALIFTAIVAKNKRKDKV